MGLSHPRYVMWAAQDGRVEDLVFHLRHTGKDALKPSANSPKRQSALHVAASRGNAQCVKVLCEAGDYGSHGYSNMSSPTSKTIYLNLRVRMSMHVSLQDRD